MENTVEQAEEFKLIAGSLCLDFANTADWHARPVPEELLTSYDRLLDWSHQTGTLTAPQAEALRRVAEARPAEAAATLDRAIVVREAIYRLFSALAAGRPLPEGDLATFNVALTAALAHLRVAANGDGPAWAWEGTEEAFDRPLWPV